MEAYASTLISNLVVIYAVLLIGMIFLYFGMMFFLGLMFHFFLGKDRPGFKLLETLMRVGTRVYAHTWMLLMSITGLVGLSLFVKSILGALFEDFVYGGSLRFGVSSSISTSAQRTDLQNGLILFILSLIIYLVHWGFAYLIETTEEKKGTILTKVFNVTGLFITSFVFFGSLIFFVFQLIGGSGAGTLLAWMFGAFPFWLLYSVRAVWMIREEK